jgi:hypothetical protein
MEKQVNADTPHDAERPVVIWSVSCPDHKIQANRDEFGRIFGNRFLPPNVGVQQNAVISTLKDRSGLARILLQRLVALVRRAAVSVSSSGG